MRLTNGGTVTDHLVAAKVASDIKTPQMVIDGTVDLKNSSTVSASAMTVNGRAWVEGIWNNTSNSGYRDSVQHRDYICKDVGSRTYCEPIGTQNTVVWPANTPGAGGEAITETCTAATNSYICTHYAGASFRGECRYTRSTGSNNQAFHKVRCCTTGAGCCSTGTMCAP
jgi:hypothetical protein